jgi:AcrR family transcriptional regulator
MNERKQHVIKHAHKLFIEKGYQSTSIQDILEESGISKGTFYNYFSSKNELLLAVFKMIYKRIDKERNDLLIGQNSADVEIFIKQLQLQMEINKENKLFSLFEEAFVSNDVDLKQYIQRYRLSHLRWVYLRFLDLFGHKKKPYLLDCAIIFSGILHNMISHNFMEQNVNESETIPSIIRYCIKRIIPIVEDVSSKEERVFSPERLNTWLPGSEENEYNPKSQLLHAAFSIKNTIHQTIREENERTMYFEYLDFIEDELLQTRKPRKFLIESAFASFIATTNLELKQAIAEFEKMATDYLDGL